MPQLTRREALRRATHQEILAAARRLLADGGPPSVTLRAVGAAVGMTAPAIYRYFPSHDDLILALSEEIAGELVAAVRDGIATAPGDQPALQLLAATRAFRSWCLGHKPEFQLAFGLAPAPAGDALPPQCDTDNVRALCGTFFLLFVDLWRKEQFAVDPDDAIPPALASQLRAFVETTGQDVPIGLAKVYLDGWIRLYGAVALEIYGHLRFIITDTDVAFETMLTEYATLLLS